MLVVTSQFNPAWIDLGEDRSCLFRKVDTDTIRSLLRDGPFTTCELDQSGRNLLHDMGVKEIPEAGLDLLKRGDKILQISESGNYLAKITG